jgi:hypothetical protein
MVFKKVIGVKEGSCPLVVLFKDWFDFIREISFPESVEEDA